MKLNVKEKLHREILSKMNFNLGHGQLEELYLAAYQKLTDVVINPLAKPNPAIQLDVFKASEHVDIVTASNKEGLAVQLIRNKDTVKMIISKILAIEHQGAVQIL